MKQIFRKFAIWLVTLLSISFLFGCASVKTKKKDPNIFGAKITVAQKHIRKWRNVDLHDWPTILWVSEEEARNISDLSSVRRYHFLEGKTRYWTLRPSPSSFSYNGRLLWVNAPWLSIEQFRTIPKASHISIEATGSQILQQNFIQELKKFNSIALQVTTSGDEKELKGIYKASLSLKNIASLDLSKYQIDDINLEQIQSLPNLIGLYLGRKDVSKKEIKQIAKLKNLRMLQLNASTVGSENFSLLKPLKKLETLMLSSNSLDKHGLSFLGDFPQLRTLTLSLSAGFFELKKLEKLQNLAVYFSKKDLSFLQNLPNLQTLELHGEYGDKDLAVLKNLKKLHSLKLSGAKLKGSGLRYLQELPKLKILDLTLSSTGDGGLVLLRSMTQIRNLHLCHTNVSDIGIAHLKQLPDLEELYLSGVSLTDTGLADIGELTKLRVLAIDKTQISDKGFVHLKGLLELRKLTISNNRIGEDSLKSIANLYLEILDISHTDIVGIGLSELFSFPHLKNLGLTKEQITNESRILLYLQRRKVKGIWTPRIANVRFGSEPVPAEH